MSSRMRLFFLIVVVLVFSAALAAQEPIPEPGAPRIFAAPKVLEKSLGNGLTVAVVERKNVPLVTVRLMIRAGAKNETLETAGLADLTAALAAKRTRTRTANQIAEQMEFLGGSLASGADWNKTVFTFTVAADKLDAAMAILGDVILNSTSDAKELELLRGQSLDSLAAELKQPSFLAGYVASRYSFGEHPPGGTLESIKSLKRSEILKFRKVNYDPQNSVLIFTGDITQSKAVALASKTFGAWKKGVMMYGLRNERMEKETTGSNRILVVDLPDSGQSAVVYSQKILYQGRAECRADCSSSGIFPSATVANSILGGGYSSRLNKEIRIKRGLSYGAGSGFAWRDSTTNFSTRTQTKDESAAEVAEIVVSEIKRLGESEADGSEVGARKLVITGDFSREFETTASLADTVTAIYGYHLPTEELGWFSDRIRAVTPAEIREFSRRFLENGDIVIAGDYRKFKDDLAKRFPNAKIQVIEADKLDLSKESLQK